LNLLPAESEGNAMGKPGRSLIDDALARGTSALDEAAGKDFFAAYGIAVPQGGTVRSADEAVRLADEIG
jgi:acyl-CoA synthetase (NDP forming)